LEKPHPLSLLHSPAPLRSSAAKLLRNRCVITAQCFRFRIAIASESLNNQSLRIRYTIEARTLRNRCTITAQCLRIRIAIASESLNNQSLRIRYTIEAQTLRNRCTIAAQPLH
jgi:hypothetical protein